MPDPTPVPDEVRALVERSNRLGSDPAVTNYGGGNTSAKVTVTSPASGEPVELLYVKGSGGDLGTLTASGFAVLERDRLVGLDRVYRGVEHEDEMVGLFAFCAHGSGGAAPSIDTPMHALVEHPHVDHLHPDSVIALACAADGEKLVEEIWGGAVAWVPWKRPGWELGRTMRELSAKEGVIGAVLGGHGLTAWGSTSQEVEDRSLRIIHEAAAYLDAHSVDEPFGPVDEGRTPLPADERRRRAAALFPHLRGVASRDSRQVGHYTDSDAVLDFLARAKTHELVHLGTSCPDHFLRTKVRPLLLDTAPDAPLDEVLGRLRGARGGVPRGVPRLLRAARDAGLPRDARCRTGHRPGARHRDVLVRRRQADRPGRRRVLRERHQRDARRRGRLDLRAGGRGRQVRRRVLGPRGAEAAAAAEAQAAGRPRRRGDRGGLRHRARHRAGAGRGGCQRRRRGPRAGEGRRRRHRPRRTRTAPSGWSST